MESVCGNNFIRLELRSRRGSENSGSNPSDLKLAQENNPNRMRTPRQLSFDHINNARVLQSDNVMFDYARLRKLIQRPERVV